MDGGELRAELLASGAFLLTATLLAVVGGLQGGAPPAVVAAYVVALAATSTVRFDVGASFTVPTQVLFLPLLVLAPPGVVPLLVAAALVLAQVPGVLRGGARASRMLSAPANAWFAVGAAAVVLVGGGVEDDETLAEALARELHEETGLAIRGFSLFGTFSDPGRIVAYADGNVYQPVTLVYRVEPEDVTVLRPSEESVELRFFGRDELPPPELAPTHVPILERYLDGGEPPFLE
jgi:8-oxo-dGTP pyrophosphatase MutT (NUDIX family)